MKRYLKILILLPFLSLGQISDVTKDVDKYKGKISLGNACDKDPMVAEYFGDLVLNDGVIELNSATLNITGKLFHGKVEITKEYALKYGLIKYNCNISLITVENSNRVPYYRKIKVYKSSSDNYLFVQAANSSLIKISNKWGILTEIRHTNRRRNRFDISRYPKGEYVIVINYENLERVIKKFDKE